jgi:hypothetical protein
MIFVFLAFMVVVVAISFYRLRRGGPGPAMNWIPRSMRPKANNMYEKHGWQAPFDGDGNRSPERDGF